MIEFLLNVDIPGEGGQVEGEENDGEAHSVPRIFVKENAGN